MIADPSIAWRILLTAEVDEPPDAAALRRALAASYAAQGWPGSGLVVDDAVDLPALRGRLGRLATPVVALGVTGRHVVVAADHAAVDGLGLLSVLAAVTGSPVGSSARGVGDRPDAAGPARTVVRRLGEVALAPPARVRGAGGDASADHDTYVARSVVGSPRTADLVIAGVRALGAVGVSRRVAVAVGVARTVEAGRIADHSALLRLRDAERLTREEVVALLRTAPTQAAPSGGGAAGGLVRLGLRVLAPRLGSTFAPLRHGAGSFLNLAVIAWLLRTTPAGRTATVPARVALPAAAALPAVATLPALPAGSAPAAAPALLVAVEA